MKIGMKYIPGDINETHVLLYVERVGKKYGRLISFIFVGSDCVYIGNSNIILQTTIKRFSKYNEEVFFDSNFDYYLEFNKFRVMYLLDFKDRQLVKEFEIKCRQEYDKLICDVRDKIITVSKFTELSDKIDNSKPKFEELLYEQENSHVNQ